MASVENLSKQLEDLEAQRSELKLQIAARHGLVDGEDVAPTQEPADKRQAELSEQMRKQEEAASKTVPAGFNPEAEAEDEDAEKAPQNTTDKAPATRSTATSTSTK